LESRRSGVGASSSDRRRRHCLPRRRELLAIRAASTPDAADARWRDRRGREPRGTDWHRLSVWAAANETVREDHPREPHTFKGRMRKAQEDLLLAAHAEGRIQATVLRLPRLLRSRRRQELPPLRVYCRLGARNNLDRNSANEVDGRRRSGIIVAWQPPILQSVQRPVSNRVPGMCCRPQSANARRTTRSAFPFSVSMYA
jgi:hypothetical protein